MFGFIIRFALLLALAGSGGAFAQDYPNKPITLIVPWAAGGPADALGRNLAQPMGKLLKQTLVVENIGGAGGTIGVGRAAKARNDGYTILLQHLGMATATALYRSLPYKTLEDFDYIGLVADLPMSVIARGNLPPNNLTEFVAYAKANKDKLTYANAGLGAASHLCGMLFMNAIQTDITTVPYKGTGPAMNDLLGGQVDFMCDQTANTAGQIRGGRVKVYAVTTKTRLPSLPNVPTLEEQGVKGAEITVWYGLYAPKGTPRPALDALVKALQGSLRDPEFRSNLAKLGIEPVAEQQATPEALRDLLKSEIERWTPIIRKAGVYAD